MQILTNANYYFLITFDNILRMFLQYFLSRTPMSSVCVSLSHLK